MLSKGGVLPSDLAPSACPSHRCHTQEAGSAPKRRVPAELVESLSSVGVCGRNSVGLPEGLTLFLSGVGGRPCSSWEDVSPLIFLKRD